MVKKRKLLPPIHLRRHFSSSSNNNRHRRLPRKEWQFVTCGQFATEPELTQQGCWNVRNWRPQRKKFNDRELISINEVRLLIPTRSSIHSSSRSSSSNPNNNTRILIMHPLTKFHHSRSSSSRNPNNNGLELRNCGLFVTAPKSIRPEWNEEN